MSIQKDLKDFLARHKLTQNEFAKIAGINPCSLSLFLSREDGKSIPERIAPYIYGGKPIATPATQRGGEDAA